MELFIKDKLNIKFSMVMEYKYGQTECNIQDFLNKANYKEMVY